MRTRLRGALACAALAPALAAAAPAVPTPTPAVTAPGLADYQHSAWTAANGAPARIRNLAQTTDGWLWLGTTDGLFRFDGLRFERVALPPRASLVRDRIDGLFAAPNGDLYLSYFGEGVSVLHPDGRVDDLPRQTGARNNVGVMAVDGDGSLWVISGNIQHFHDGRWEVVADDVEWRAAAGTSMLLDGSGRLWAANDHGVWQLDRKQARFARVGEDGGELLLAPDGGVWQVDGARPARLLAAGAAPWPASYRHARGRIAGQFDDDGALWRLECPQPLCRQAGSGAPVIPAEPLSGQDTHVILEDREGDLWIATENGLDRFRRNRFVRSGLPGAGARYSLGADGAGRMWAADHETGAFWRLAPDAAPLTQARAPVSVIASGRDGALLVGDARAIERRSGATTETIPLPPGPDGKPLDHHMIGILDDGRELWTTTMETGLIGWRDGRWWPHTRFTLPAKIYQSAPAGPGQLWLATGEGELVFYDHDKLTRFDIRAVGLAAAIFPGDPLTVSGASGFGALEGGRLRTLRGADPDALRNVSGMVVTPDGDRWLNGAAGVAHVRAADWRRSMDDPSLPLRYELFGAADGYPGEASLDTRWPSAMSADGRNLWLVATGGVVRLDTADLRRNRAAPRAVIQSVAVGDVSYPAQAALALAPGSANFRIQYTAPALHMPERVRFEYRLDGVDRGWQDAGTRRATSYTNVAPGDYLFRVRAINEDGQGGAGEASLRLRLAPTLVQTLWFKLACALAIGLLGALLYRYRVRYLTRRLTERLQVRTAERERIARTLHDTFLQTVQGLMLRVDAIAAELPPQERTRDQLERVLHDAGQAIGEGRGQLQELRAGDAHVLEDVVVEAVTRLRASHGALTVDLRVDGERRPLLVAAAEEIAEIAREVLRNAFAHAGAQQLRVTIAYGRRALSLTIADDGGGFDPAAVRAGHWGLVGMRERARRIGARLDLDSGRDGTTVRLSVPGARAYAGG